MIRREDPAMAVCPECEADVEIDEFDVDKGEIISCPECGVELEVVGLAPLELDLAQLAPGQEIGSARRVESAGQ